MSLPFEKKL
jgi:Asp-tRNA(Asn)/Glu-tRNA(Gln) amidotransferase B subunit